MKTNVISLYSDMRVVVRQRKLDGHWEVWPQKFIDGKWLDHAGDVVAVRQKRTDALMIALQFSTKLLKSLEGIA